MAQDFPYSQKVQSRGLIQQRRRADLLGQLSGRAVLASDLVDLVRDQVDHLVNLAEKLATSPPRAGTRDRFSTDPSEAPPSPHLRKANN